MAMWEGTRENSESKEFAGVVKRYKKMLSEEQMGFFDVSDFEHIVDHYIDKNQLTNALQACEIAISQHPHSLMVKIKKAQVLIGQLKTDKALDLLMMLVEIESTNPEVLLMLGNCYSLQGEENIAYSYYRKAEKFSFDDRDELLYNIGAGYVQNADYPRAIHFLEKAYIENNKTTVFCTILPFVAINWVTMRKVSVITTNILILILTRICLVQSGDYLYTTGRVR